MNANPVLLQKKYAQIISRYSEKYCIDAMVALDLFYSSSLYHQIAEGVSDLHCMSPEYLAEELHEEVFTDISGNSTDSGGGSPAGSGAGSQVFYEK